MHDDACVLVNVHVLKVRFVFVLNAVGGTTIYILTTLEADSCEGTRRKNRKRLYEIMSSFYL